MLILEKPFSNEEFYPIYTLEDLKNSPNNSTLVFAYCDSSLELYNFCKINSIAYGVITDSIKEMIFVSGLNAKYIFTDILQNAKKFQDIANEYLLDTKVIYLADTLDEIEDAAPLGIDGIKLKEKKWQSLKSHRQTGKSS